MKRLVYNLVATFIIVVLGFVSCKEKISTQKANDERSNEEVLLKSNLNNPFEGINEQFDLWFSNNSTRLESVTREEIISFDDEEVQVMIFNVIPADRKALAWREKYDELLALDTYNNQQKAFLRSLRGKATTSLFSNHQVAEAQLVFF